MKLFFKRRVAGLLAFIFACSVLTVNSFTVLATPEKGFDDVGRMIAAEGIVMLQNPALLPEYPDQEANVIGKVLPIEKGETVSVFGRTQLRYYNSGTGSGGDVKIQNYEADNILAGLRGNPKLNVNEALVTEYTNWVNNDPNNAFNSWALGGWNPMPFGQKEMQVTPELAQKAAAVSDTAIVVIGRTAGEDHDMPAGGHDTNPAQMGYELSNREKTMISEAYKAFKRVVIVMNCANIMDMSWAKDYPNAAILYAWTGGQKGGYAIADVLTGDITPSGKLTDTMAENLAAYYARGNTADGKVQFGDWSLAFYGEDIYVGYRYFETFADAYNKVLYPFGFGLSYTTFDIKTDKVEASGDHINVHVTVRNTGKVKGKEVVQVYYGAPQGNLGNPAKELAAFAKTRVLYPGEEQAITLSFRIDEMASYDESDASYKLLAGDYNIYVGNCVRAGEPWGTTNEQVHTYNVPETKVTEALTNVMPPVRDFQRIKPTGAPTENGTYALDTEAVPTLTATAAQERLDNLRAARIEKLTQYAPDEAAANTKLLDVYQGKTTLTDFVNSLSKADLSAIVIAPGMSPSAVPAGGSAGMFGGVTTGRDAENNSDLKGARGVPPVTMADGPSGIRLQSKGNYVDGIDYSQAPYNLTQFATNFASGTAIACTWNVELTELLAEYWGKELVKNYIDVVLGPGINIHRFPLNGRNFEYFSEDPLLTGAFAAAFVRGVQSQGPAPMIKHFACNNQETGRHTTDSIVSVRALREIYLKPFQIAVEDGGARVVMTSYNPVNGLWSANNPDLSTTLLREEWGFEGVVVTDWWPRINSTVGSGSDQGTNTVYMVRAQNDIYSVADGGSGNSQVTGTSHGNRFGEIYNAYTEENTGGITRKELSRSARNILQFAMATPAFARNNGFAFDTSFANASAEVAAALKYAPTALAERRFYTDTVSGNPLLTGITVGGRAITTFDQLQLDYHVYMSETIAETKGYPEVQAEAVDGSVVKSITQATKMTPVAVIVVEKNGSERVYKVTLTPNGGNILADGVAAKLQDIQLDGTTIGGFNPDTLKYLINWTSTTRPVITVTPAANCELRTAATDNGDGTFTLADSAYDAVNGMVSITVESTDEKTTYVIRLVNLPKSDDFNNPEINKFWLTHAENDKNWTLDAAPGNLRITAEAGDVYQNGGNAMKNIFYQYGYGNWEAVMKFNMNHIPNAAFNGVGLMVFDDLDNYVWLDYEYNNTGSVGGRAIGMVQETNAVYGALDRLTQGGNAAGLDAVVGTATTVWMKMIKDGDTYTGAVSIDGVNYHTFDSVVKEYKEPKIGITVYNGTAATQPPLFYSDIEYIHFNPKEMDGTVSDIYSGITLKPGELKPAALTVAPPVTTEVCDDIDGGLAYVSKENGETAGYKVNVKVPGTYTITARAKTNTNEAGAQMDINASLNDTQLGSFSPNATDGKWVTLTIADVELPAGESTLWLNFTRAGIRLNTLSFSGPASAFDLSKLEAALAQAPTSQGDNKDGKWAEYVPVLEKAQNIFEKPLSQEQADNMAAELLVAIQKLMSGITSDIAPKAMTTMYSEGKRIDRIYFKDLPWMWMSSTNARFEGSGETSNIGYVSNGDVFYFGQIDTTGLSEIKLNYACGLGGSNQWQPSMKVDFYTTMEEAGTINKTTTHSASSIEYTDLFRGGTLKFGNYFGGINFLHGQNQGWGNYGIASTTGDENAPDRHPNMKHYWEVGIGKKTFLNPAMIGGMQNVYMQLSENNGNFRYAEFIYDLVDVTYDWGFEGAPEAPAGLTITKGTPIGELPTPDFNRPGYTFGGWSVTGEYDAVTADSIIDEDTTLKAIWAPNIWFFPVAQHDYSAVILQTGLRSEDNDVTNAHLVLAVYDANGKLLAYETTTVDYDDETSTRKELTAELPEGAATVKAFLWDSDYAPIVSAEGFSVEELPAIGDPAEYNPE